MTNRIDTIFNDSRTQVRVKDNRRVYWKVESGSKMGKGRIRNISTTGMLLETNSDFIPSERSHFSFDTNLGHDNYIPQNGQLIWSKKQKRSGNRHLCGIKFIAPGEYVSSKLRHRIQKGLRKIVTARRLRTISSALLMTVMIGLVVFVAKESGLIYKNLDKSAGMLIDTSEQQAALTQSYASRYYTSQLLLQSTLEDLEATKILYSESESILGDVRTELSTTRSLLSETERMLTQAQAELAALEKEITRAGNANRDPQAEKISANIAALQAESETKRIELEKSIVDLQIRNEQLNKEMTELETQLSYLSGNIKTVEDGQALIRTYKDRMQQVRAKIKEFKNEARSTRKAALVERDRIRLAIGNNGFLMRDGQTVEVDQVKYNQAMEEALRRTQAPSEGEAASAPKIKIDVSFVE